MDSDNIKKGIVNCPFCRGVIFKDFEVKKKEIKTSFIMRCPHCQKNIEVEMTDHQIIIKELK